MKECHIRINEDLFLQVKLIAKKYNMSINKTFIKLIEVGYLNMVKIEYGETDV